MSKELKILVRTHHGVGQALCALCGQLNHSIKTGTGLYDGEVHLGDICRQCLQGGRRGALARTRSHSTELRQLAEHARSYLQNRKAEQYYLWLHRYAEFLENLASRLEEMTDWIPRPG